MVIGNDLKPGEAGFVVLIASLDIEILIFKMLLNTLYELIKGFIINPSNRLLLILFL